MPKKKKAGVNKSQVIREALTTHKDASTSEIAAIVNQQGLDVDSSYVSAVKSQMKSRRRKKKTARRKKTAAASSSDQISVAALLEVKRAADKVGGIDKASEALNALKKLG